MIQNWKRSLTVLFLLETFQQEDCNNDLDSSIISTQYAQQTCEFFAHYIFYCTERVSVIEHRPCAYGSKKQFRTNSLRNGLDRRTTWWFFAGSSLFRISNRKSYK